MAALTSSRKYMIRATAGQRIETYKLAANVMIWNGALVSVSAAGYVIPAATTAGTLVIGIAQSEVSNLGGAAGAKEVTVLTGIAVTMANATAGAAVAQAHYLRPIYALDDQTVTNAAGIVAGTLHLIDSDGVWLFVDSAINAAIQAAIAA